METDYSAPALVVFSGGQDSHVCLHLARKEHLTVYAVSFSYGQRHGAAELAAARAITGEWNIPHQVVEVPFFNALQTSALLKRDADISAGHPLQAGIPASYVPNRNALFMTMAHALAQEVGARSVYTGVSAADYSGYPDCRPEYISALETALNTGISSPVKFVTPLIAKTKAQTFELAGELGVLAEALHSTHTCYEGDTTPRIWGKGCGQCPACVLREKGFSAFLTKKKKEI